MIAIDNPMAHPGVFHKIVAVRGPVIDRVVAKYVKHKAPAIAALAVPVGIIVDRFDATALKLWHNMNRTTRSKTG